MNFVLSVLCLKQGNTIEEVVVNRVCILELFCPKQGQGLTDLSGSPIPQNGSPLGRGGGGVFGSILAPLTPSVTASLRDVEINRFFGGILKIEDEMRNVW